MTISFSTKKTCKYLSILHMFIFSPLVWASYLNRSYFVLIWGTVGFLLPIILFYFFCAKVYMDDIKMVIKYYGIPHRKHNYIELSYEDIDNIFFNQEHTIVMRISTNRDGESHRYRLLIRWSQYTLLASILQLLNEHKVKVNDNFTEFFTEPLLSHDLNRMEKRQKRSHYSDCIFFGLLELIVVVFLVIPFLYMFISLLFPQVLNYNPLQCIESLLS